MCRKLFLLLVILFFVANPVAAYYSLGEPKGYVSDFANLMSPTAKASLESELTQFEQTTKHEIAVVTINSLQGDYIENFAEKLFADWKIGKKGADNGVLFLISKEDRQMRIEVGYGLEGALTDLQSSAIINQIAKPNFQNSDFDNGINLAVAEIEKAIKGEELSIKPAANDQVDLVKSNIAIWFIIFLFFSWRVLFAFLGKTKSWWPGGAFGAVIGAILGVILAGLMGAVIIAIILGGLGLLCDWGASRRNWFRRDGSGGIFGGRSGGFGGGFGGFGGGRSGGGGSSGSW